MHMPIVVGIKAQNTWGGGYLARAALQLNICLQYRLVDESVTIRINNNKGLAAE